MALLKEVVWNGTTGETEDKNIQRVKELFGKIEVFFSIQLNPDHMYFEIVQVFPNTYTDEVNGKIYVIAPQHHQIRMIWPEKGREEVKYVCADVEKSRDGDFTGRHPEKVGVNAVMVRQGNDFLYILINPANFHHTSLRPGWLGI